MSSAIKRWTGSSVVAAGMDESGFVRRELAEAYHRRAILAGVVRHRLAV